MSKEKIIISFDDDVPSSKENKLTIENISENKININDEIKSSLVNTIYKADSQLTSFDKSDFKYPDGVNSCFHKKYSIDLKDNFLNSVLLNNLYAIFASKSGKIYIVDRYNGKLLKCVNSENDSFEKPGIVIENKIFLNSVNSLILIDFIDEQILRKKIYITENGYFIWSNINISQDIFIFLEYSPSLNNAFLLTLDKNEPFNFNKIEIKINNYICDSLIIKNEKGYIFCDDKIIIYDINNNNIKEYHHNININSETKFILLNNKLYFNTYYNELYYFDIFNFDLKFTGIKLSYINSIAGFDDYIFLGTIDGWKCFKTNGTLQFSFDDFDENKLQAISKNILVVSKRNKIVMHNLNKYHEAEGFNITRDIDNSEMENILSARIFNDGIFVLTKNGIFESFTNNKINLTL